MFPFGLGQAFHVTWGNIEHVPYVLWTIIICLSGSDTVVLLMVVGFIYMYVPSE